MSKLALIGLFFFPLIVSILAVKDVFENKKIKWFNDKVIAISNPKGGNPSKILG